jgi:pimeloyl-ACP methyl ester carboxylesterase
MTVTLLFVHSPLVGPTTWALTADVLRSNGFRCYVPDMTGVASAGPPYYPKFADVAAQALHGTGDEPVVLVGHSAAGPLLPAIADVLSGRVGAAVFADAQLPHPGLSWLDTAPAPLREQLLGMVRDGLLPPWHEWFPPGAIAELLPDRELRRRLVAEVPRLPVAYFEEAAPATRNWDTLRRALLRFSAPYDLAADEAERLGWWVARKDWDHLRMLTAPVAVADLIAQAISATLAD